MSTPTLTQRIASIDIMRGIVMVLMALDHTRDFFHNDALIFDPSDPARTSVALFITRFITHFCAPTFVLLTGTAIYLQAQRKTKPELSQYLLTRGFILVVMEVTLISFAWFFDVQLHVHGFQVIGVIGVSMLVMAGLIYLPYNAILISSLVIICGHNLLDGVHGSRGTLLSFIWSFLHEQSFFPYGGDRAFFIRYPLLPWLSIMMLGYTLGKLFVPEAEPFYRFKQLTRFGLLAIGAFFVLRLTNIYGDHFPWYAWVTNRQTALAFFVLEKYPPSLQYILITIGPVLIALAFIEKYQSKWQNPFRLFGSVPMFYYIAHLYLIHGLLLLAIIVTGGNPAMAVINFAAPGFTPPPGTGIDLIGTYAIWAGVVLVLYPLCLWYSKVKASHPSSLLRYL